MTSQRPVHERFDELAAGYALHALESAEEAEFLRHAEDCGRCQQALADYAEVAAAMADLAAPAEASPDLAARIMEAATAVRPAPDQDSATASAAARDQDGESRRDRLGGRMTSAGAGTDRQRRPSPEAGAAPELTAEAGGWRGLPGQPGGRPAPSAESGQGHGAQVIPLERRRARLVKFAAAAAAAVVLTAGGIWAGLSASSGPASPQPLAACTSEHQCSEVTLTDSSGHRQAAKVVVRAGSVWLIPAGLPADNPARQIYVLWQITGAHTPLAVGSFDIRSGHNAPIKIGGLAAPYGSTWAFAISLEHGRTIPAKPSRPVALGQTT